MKMRVTTQKVSSQLGPGTTWAQRGSMWWGSVTLRVKGKEVPREVTRVRSRMTQDEVKSGVNLMTQAGRDSETRREEKQIDLKQEGGIFRTCCIKMKRGREKVENRKWVNKCRFRHNWRKKRKKPFSFKYYPIKYVTGQHYSNMKWQQ